LASLRSPLYRLLRAALRSRQTGSSVALSMGCRRCVTMHRNAVAAASDAHGRSPGGPGREVLESGPPPASHHQKLAGWSTKCARWVSSRTLLGRPGFTVRWARRLALGRNGSAGHRPVKRSENCSPERNSERRPTRRHGTHASLGTLVKSERSSVCTKPLQAKFR
jgi:hypothetical protein